MSEEALVYTIEWWKNQDFQAAVLYQDLCKNEQMGGSLALKSKDLGERIRTKQSKREAGGHWGKHHEHLSFAHQHELNVKCSSETIRYLNTDQ